MMFCATNNESKQGKQLRTFSYGYKENAFIFETAFQKKC